MTIQMVGPNAGVANEGFYLRALAKRMLKDRAIRGDFLPVSIFSEAAWDALLILFCEIQPTHCAETLALRLDLPLTTMGRWIAVLESEDLIEARPPSLLPERETVRLSKSGLGAVQDYLRATTK